MVHTPLLTRLGLKFLQDFGQTSPNNVKRKVLAVKLPTLLAERAQLRAVLVGPEQRCCEHFWIALRNEKAVFLVDKTAACVSVSDDGGNGLGQ